MMFRIILDPGRTAPLEPDWIEIRTEMDFLRHCNDQGTLLIRGVVCDWAELYYHGRGISFEFSTSQSDQLRSLCPLLSEEQAVTILNRFGKVFGNNISFLTVSDLINLIHPDEIWEMQPSVEHFARYLLWLYLNAPSELTIPLIKVQAQKWGENHQGGIHIPYELASDCNTSLTILHEWLGIHGDGQWRQLGSFQYLVPQPIREQAREAWKRRIVETRGQYFLTLLTKGIPRSLISIAAEETFYYFESHAGQLEKSFAERLLPYLGEIERAELLKLIPPPQPKPMPIITEDVIAWVKEEYLPFREWQVIQENSEAHQTTLDCAFQFASWYLDKYPTMLLGQGREHLSFAKMECIAGAFNDAVTLVLILDGLNLYDARIISDKIVDLIPGLSIIKNEAAFVPLPTVTQFCKAALISGVAPNLIADTTLVGEVIQQGKSPLAALESARLGSIILWNILEPDLTYHTSADDKIISRNVNAQFESIANKLKDVLDNLPKSKSLRVVLTSDHGRMKSKSSRKIVVPQNMVSHGRAAWGESRTTFEASGYKIEGDLVYLEASRFGLSEDTVIPIHEDTFLTSDGKSGQEAYSHGGLFPEEVLVPWIEYAFNIARPKIEVTVTGSGYAENRGSLKIEVLNLSADEVFLDTLEVVIPGQMSRMVNLNWKLKPRDQEIHETEVNWWPTKKQARQINGIAHFNQGAAIHWMQPCTITIESKELYSTDTPDILAGL